VEHVINERVNLLKRRFNSNNFFGKGTLWKDESIWVENWFCRY